VRTTPSARARPVRVQLRRLFFQETLLAGSLAALRTVAERSASWNMLISVGIPLVVDHLLFNCAVTLYCGRAVAVAPKAHPPNYREFYELRWFHPPRARAREIVLLDERVRSAPMSSCTPHTCPVSCSTPTSARICGPPVPPGTIAALSGATVLANLSASNVTVGKREYRQDLVRSSAAKNLAVQMYSAAGFGESTADLAWDGHGLVAERGELVAETERFALAGTAVTVDVDPTVLVQDRMRQSSWGQNAALHARSFRSVVIGTPEDRRDAAVFRTLRRSIEPKPFVPADPSKRDLRCREIFMIKSTALARRLLALPEDARRVVIGVSGGQDSTEALLVAVHAMDLLGLPARPRARYDHAGVRHVPADVRERVRAGARSRRHAARDRDHARRQPGILRDRPRSDARDLTFENVQAWTRKLLLFALAGQERGIDLGTGDLSEIALGFATYGGDHMSHYGVNAGVPKTLISYLIQWAADEIFAREPEVARVLRAVLETPISPELRRLGEGGTITQRSEDLVGPYELHDFFLYYLLRFGLGPAAHRAHGAARLRRPLPDRRRAPLAARLPAALLRQPVQARLHAGCTQGRLGRIAVAARRLAHALGCVGHGLAHRGRDHSAIGLTSAAAEDDQAVGRIVGRDGDRHAITGNDADVVAAHAAADLGEELHAVVALHAVVSAGERLGDGPLDLDEIVASQLSSR
jgi:NAD+ synthase (glutamine-hydrolysing)